MYVRYIYTSCFCKYMNEWICVSVCVGLSDYVLTHECMHDYLYICFFSANISFFSANISSSLPHMFNFSHLEFTPFNYKNYF